MTREMKLTKFQVVSGDQHWLIWNDDPQATTFYRLINDLNTEDKSILTLTVSDQEFEGYQVAYSLSKNKYELSANRTNVEVDRDYWLYSRSEIYTWFEEAPISLYILIE